MIVMKLRLWILLILLGASCASPATMEPIKPMATDNADFPDLGAAPELSGEVWINSDAPLRLSDLHGQVVLVEMWTFG
jgi:hypothetical protein